MMRTARKAHLTNHMASMTGVVDQCQAHLNDPLETIFYEPFKNITGSTLREEIINIFILNLVGTSEEQELLQSEALLAIEFVIQPGFQNLIDFLESEYLPKTRPGSRFLIEFVNE